jgi:hypothetical protein
METQLWLLAVEVTGWWDKEATFYSRRMCERLYDVIIQINFRQHSPNVQRVLLSIFQIIYSRFPDLQGLEVEPVLDIAFEYIPSKNLANGSYMWHEDNNVKRVAREVVSLIADHRGGDLNIFNTILKKISSIGIWRVRVQNRFCREYKYFPEPALDLWMILTRLLKEHITFVGEDQIFVWLDIPLVSTLSRGIMFSR